MGSQAIDPTMMIKMMFGGEVFDDLIGELSLIAMMSMKEEEMAGKTEEEVMMMMDIKKAEKIAKIEIEIMKKIELYLGGDDKSMTSAVLLLWRLCLFADSLDFASQGQDINDKLEAPGGIAILAAIGWVMVSVRLEYSGGSVNLVGSEEEFETFFGIRRKACWISRGRS